MQKRQTHYATTIQQDRELLERLSQTEASGPLEGSSRRQKMAIQVRIGEKEILQQLSTMLEEFIANETQSQNGQGAKRNAQNSPENSRKSKQLRT